MERVLFALSLFKVQRFLSSGLRLRTACDLAVHSIVVKAPDGFNLPSLDDVAGALPSLIKGAQKHFASPAVTTATFIAGEKKPKAQKTKDVKASAS